MEDIFDKENSFSEKVEENEEDERDQSINNAEEKKMQDKYIILEYCYQPKYALHVKGKNLKFKKTPNKIY